MKVPLVDLSRIHQPLEKDLNDAFMRVLHQGSFILGPEVTRFEANCAAYLGVKHAIGVSSGSDALLLALMALGVGPGDEVICPTYTFFATAGAVSRLGAKPVFVDSCPDSFNLNPQLIPDLRTAKTKAIIPVHLFGQCAEMQPLLEWAEHYGIPVIEDAAQAIGATYQGQKAGSMGLFGCFSFFPSKNLGGFGDGGLLTTNDDALADKARVLRAHGSKPKYLHHLVGGNFRLDALQAALLDVKLPFSDQYAQQRQECAERYTALLLEKKLTNPENSTNSPLRHPQLCQPGHVYNQYVIQLPQKGLREKLQTFLKERGVETAVYYPLPLHMQPCFADLGYREGQLPIAEQAAHTTLALPIFPGLTAAEQTYVVEQIAVFFESVNE